MSIIACQCEGKTCRFIYKSGHSYHVVSVENNNGMHNFLGIFGGKYLDKSVDLYEYIAMLEKVAAISAKF